MHKKMGARKFHNLKVPDFSLDSKIISKFRPKISFSSVPELQIFLKINLKFRLELLFNFPKINLMFRLKLLSF